VTGAGIGCDSTGVEKYKLLETLIEGFESDEATEADIVGLDQPVADVAKDVVAADQVGQHLVGSETQWSQ